MDNTQKLYKFITVYLLLMFIVIGSCQASTNKKLELLSKPILPKEMMRGYKLRLSEIHPRSPEDAGQVYQEVWFTDKKPGVINIRVAVLDKEEHAELYALQLAANWKDADYFKKGFGEKYWVYLSPSVQGVKYPLINPIGLVFIKGKTVVKIEGRGYYGYPPTESRDFFEKVARYVESKI